MSKDKVVPVDRKQCQTYRPNTWPKMPSFMTFGPVRYRRCNNIPTWIADNGEGEMSLCQECKEVCERTVLAKYTPIEQNDE